MGFHFILYVGLSHEFESVHLFVHHADFCIGSNFFSSFSLNLAKGACNELQLLLFYFVLVEIVFLL